MRSGGRAAVCGAVIILAFGACSAGPASRRSAAVRLHGWIVWPEQMPFDYDAAVNSGSTFATRSPYASAAAVSVCSQGDTWISVEQKQVAVANQAGDTVAGVSVDVATLRTVRTAQEVAADSESDTAGAFGCLVEWRSPAIKPSQTYTVTFDGHSRIVNRGAEKDPVFLPS